MPSEYIFRGQLVIPEQRLLYDHWCRIAQNKPMPSRDSFNPMKVPRLLPAISVIDIKPELEDSKIRLAGSRLSELYGFEIAGKTLSELKWGKKTSYWLAAYRRILSDKCPLQGISRGPAPERDHLIQFWLRLPLSDDGKNVNKILCHDISFPVISESAQWCEAESKWQ